MEVIVDGKHVRIKGKNNKIAHLLIYLDESDGKDYFRVSIVKAPFEIGNFPILEVYKDKVLFDNEVMH